MQFLSDGTCCFSSLSQWLQYVAIANMRIAKSRKRTSVGGKPVKRSIAATKARREADAKANNRKAAEKVRLYMEDNEITRLQLEAKVGRSKSTMDHFFAGDFAPALLARVEHALGQKFGEDSGTSPPEWGGYTQDSTTQLVGSYLTLRYDFKNSALICAYVTAIEWSKIEHAHIYDGRIICPPRIDGYGLVFREERRADAKYAHRGQVWYPPGQFVYLVTAYGDGRLRAAILSIPDHDGQMMGIQLSLYNPKGMAFTPAAAPIALLRRQKIADLELGTISPGAPYYDEYNAILTSAFGDVVFSLPTTAPAT